MSERFKYVLRWVLGNPGPAGFSLLGLFLVVASFFLSGQGSAVLLEFGAGLALVVVIYGLEKSMEDSIQRRNTEQINEVERKLTERMDEKLREAAESVVDTDKQLRYEVAEAFATTPTVASLVELGERAREFNAPETVTVEIYED